MDTSYLYRYLQTKVDHLRGSSQGLAQGVITREMLSSLLIPLPPLPEQRRIAAILDEADALRRKRKRAIELLDSVTQSIFLEMFGAEHDDYASLEKFIEEFRYGTSNKSAPDGHPVLRIPNVVGDEVNLNDLKSVPIKEAEFQRLQLRVGDLLIVRSNGNPEYVGRSAVIDDKSVRDSGHDVGDFVYASYLIRARINSDLLDPYFLQTYLSSDAGRKAMLERAKTSAGQFNINTEGLASIPVPIVPRADQCRFSEAYHRVRDAFAGHVTIAATLDQLFSSLQHRAFSGQL